MRHTRRKTLARIRDITFGRSKLSKNATFGHLPTTNSWGHLLLTKFQLVKAASKSTKVKISREVRENMTRIEKSTEEITCKRYRYNTSDFNVIPSYAVSWEEDLSSTCYIYIDINLAEY